MATSLTATDGISSEAETARDHGGEWRGHIIDCPPTAFRAMLRRPETAVENGATTSMTDADDMPNDAEKDTNRGGEACYASSHQRPQMMHQAVSTSSAFGHRNPKMKIAVEKRRHPSPHQRPQTMHQAPTPNSVFGHHRV